MKKSWVILTSYVVCVWSRKKLRLALSGSEHAVRKSKFTQGLDVNASLTEFTQGLF